MTVRPGPGRLISAGEIDWNLLYDLADYHTVKPQLADFFSGILQDLVPGDVSEKLQEARRQNLVDQLDHVSEFFRVCRRLVRRVLRSFPLRDSGWLRHFYGNLAARESADIDVFVRYSDLGKIREADAGDGLPYRGPLPVRR